MQPSGNSGGKNGGDNKRCELQHSVHDVPPDLRCGEVHGHRRSQSIDKKELTERSCLEPYGDKHTLCRAGRGPTASTRSTTHHRFANLSPHSYPTIDLTQPEYGIFSRSKPRHLTLPPGVNPRAKATKTGT